MAFYMTSLCYGFRENTSREVISLLRRLASMFVVKDIIDVKKNIVYVVDLHLT